MKKQRYETRSQHGQSFVEMAVTLPLILLVFLGMVEVGFAAHTYLVVVNASREGARFGSRGVHVSTDDIISVVETAIQSNFDLNFEGEDANATIIVSEIDIDANGDYQIYDQGVLGALSMTSTICEPTDLPCNPHDLNLQEFINTNHFFNSTEGLCNESGGCNSDFIVVEVTYMYESAVLSGFVREFIPSPFPVTGRAVMRVLHRRAPDL
jgi:hypothetical protein